MPDGVKAFVKDGVAWRVGTRRDVAWINESTVTGLAITSAIPPVFADYATLAHPAQADSSGDISEQGKQDRALLALLQQHTPEQSWWLGYLQTGARRGVFEDAPMVKLYAGWQYVLLQAGPESAAAWRRVGQGSDWKRTQLPDLMFPEDRSWLVSMLWDDDWICIGGPTALIAAMLADRDLARRARRVAIDENATPPGHTAR